jgi:hypothetical protein
MPELYIYNPSSYLVDNTGIGILRTNRLMLCKEQVFIVNKNVVWQNTDFLLSEQVVHTVPTEL